MVYQLERSEYEKARSLFHGQNLALVIEAVIAGNSPAMIWVDNAAYPGAALMWDKAHCFYLVGANNNLEFTGNLSELVVAQIFPEARRRGLNIFKVYYTDAGWETQIHAIFPKTPFRKLARVFYTFDQLKTGDWKDRLLVGFQMRAIDQTLLTNVELKNIQAVIDEIESCWNSVESFLKNGFGFCLLHDQEIVCWCTAEYVSGPQCGIGVETVESYMNQGFATLTASAFVSYCHSNRITPHWDSWKANLPSVAVAEKIGFRKVLDYCVYLGEMNGVTA
jgi:hypothetical protein